MDQDSGFSASGAPYEYTVSEKKTAALTLKRITLIALYVLWAIGLLLVGAAVKIIVPLLAFIPLSLWVLVWLTWRLTQVEYEISIFAGTVTVSRILGGRSRKVLCEANVRSFEAVLPCDEESAKRVEIFDPEATIFAASHESAPDLFVILFKDEEGTRTALYFEPTAKALKILRYHNPSAVTMRQVSR